ncbi:hypothetical protein PCYB_142200 [Plasmodium cynomolgi strain B]|uniref:Uncharacterized protein n=1 Tax=Plasmodium cynomolgi (strain B) TaxID=1120755 RepID=K6VHE8_PLACD|nr:hypothetical protein PCYB_142200 [Plasmodium cynomolgi strain B]GAB68792.1 hypothetical protein PCYB_142200 [Plasmodium cynomolgi strain B]
MFATVISPVVTVQPAPVVYTTTYSVVPQTVVYTIPQTLPIIKNIQVIPSHQVCLSYAYAAPVTTIIL